jgi:YHS domain-containing protein
MFKQLVLTFAIISLLSVFANAQEQPETTNTEKKECSKDSKSCCGSKEEQSNMQMKESTETASVQIWNKVCPVKGEEVDADSPIVEYNGKVIGFCCPGCDSKFQKDPEKYMKNLNEDGTKFIGKS